MAILSATFFCAGFADKPKVAPSRAQEVLRGSKAAESQSSAKENREFFLSIKRLFTNVNFVLLFLTYGLNVGVFYAISTLLNTVVLNHFEVGS